jgi:hypothetical protein
MKITPSSFRRGVKWVLSLLLFHFVGFLLYSFLIGNIVRSLYYMDENLGATHGVLIAFQCLYWLLIAFWAVFRGEMTYADVQRNIKNAAKEEGFSAMRYFTITFVKDWVWKTAAFIIFQLPFTAFFAGFGLALDEGMTIIEKFYMANAGFYAATGSALVGLLLSAVYFFVIMVAVNYISYQLILKRRL